MQKRSLILFILLVVCFFYPYAADADASRSKDQISPQKKKESLLCSQIQEKINTNQDLRKYIKTSIQMGYDACGTIKCAVKAGGELKNIIEGANDAGCTKDVISKCALDAGANSKEIAAILNSVSAPGICFVLPEEPELIAFPPAGKKEGFLLSPSGF